MEENEIKFVHREETFTDNAVKSELAKTRAACLCRLQFGRCKRENCKTCSLHYNYLKCYNSMTEYDKIRLSHNVSVYYQEYSRDPFVWRTGKGMQKAYLKTILIPIIILFLLLFVINVGANAQEYNNPFRIQTSVSDSIMKIKKMNMDINYVDNTAEYSKYLAGKYSPKRYYAKLDKHISEYMDETISQLVYLTQMTVIDCTLDGEINCQDYAATFKRYWDMHFPDKANKCKIIRNNNPLFNYHHVFIRIEQDGSMPPLNIEPNAPVWFDWGMHEAWGMKYNPMFNIRFDETSKWYNKGKSFLF